MGKTFLLTIDLEEFERTRDDRRFSLSKQGLEALSALLTQHNILATFFTTAAFATKYPDEVKTLSDAHEIALHALYHGDNYRTMEVGEAGARLAEAKKALENITTKEIIGFRAPQMQAPAMNILKEIGIRYDSSLHPTYVPGRYSHHKETMDIHDVEGVVRVPVSVTPKLRMAYSWIWFRMGGVWYAKQCTKATEKKKEFVTIYFHPWDFVDLRKEEGISWVYARNTNKSLIMLERYLLWLKDRGYNFSTMGGYLREKEFI